MGAWAYKIVPERIDVRGRPHPLPVGLLATALAIAVAPACRQPDAPAVRRTVRLTTGTPGAAFYPLSQALERAWAAASPGFDVQTRDSAGSVANVEAIQNGSADVGLAFADVAYTAYVAWLAKGAPEADSLRGIAVLELAPVHLVVRRDSTIASVADLRGCRVAVGPGGSGSAITAQLVLAALGIDLKDVRVESLRYNEAAERLKAGTIDALFVTGRDPVEAVRDAIGAGARMLPLAGPAIERLRHEYPFYRQTQIPGGTYPGHPDPLDTIGVDSLLVCRRGLDEALVHDLTARFFAVLPSLPMLSFMDLDQAPATPIPLHEGAGRYYRERELSR
jgi:hypothetical protein